MTDLIPRLRALADRRESVNLYVADLCREAADALEHRESYNESEAKRAYDFEHALGHCQAERDTLNAKLEDYLRTPAGAWQVEWRIAEGCTKTAQFERDEARAEAAALREALNTIFAAWGVAPWHRSDGGPEAPYCLPPQSWRALNYGPLGEQPRQAISQPGPGAALLLRVKKLEAVAEAARRLGRCLMEFSEPTDAGCAACHEYGGALDSALAALDADAKEGA